MGKLYSSYVILIGMPSCVHAQLYNSIVLLLDIAEWERMVDVVKWSGGERLEDSPSPDTDISSYSEDLSIASCHSPEIGKRSTMEEDISVVS